MVSYSDAVQPHSVSGPEIRGRERAGSGMGHQLCLSLVKLALQNSRRRRAAACPGALGTRAKNILSRLVR
jgi:hypothetical protein